MAQIFAAIQSPERAWRMQGPENSCTFEAVSDIGLNYNTGSPDTVPAGNVAAVDGGGTVMDRTTDVWVIYTVQASNVLSAAKESALPSSGTFALLWRVTMHTVAIYQQT